jgi:predicted RecB family nuclease
MSQGEIISATRLRRFIMCARLPYMDKHGSPSERDEPASLRWAQDLGVRHEEHVAAVKGLATANRRLGVLHDARGAKNLESEHIREAPRRPLEIALAAGTSPSEVAADTERLMAEGRDGVRDGLLIVHNWWGSPDWIRKTSGRSRLGAWHYFPIDAKATSKMPTRAHILPTIFYALQLERIQGVRPQTVLIEGRQKATAIETRSYVVETLATVQRLQRMLDRAEDPGPQIGSKCDRCSWRRTCHKDAVRTHHLSLLPDTPPSVRDALVRNGVGTLAALAAADPARLVAIPALKKRASRLIVQARALTDGRPRVIHPSLLPVPAPVEAFIDFEGLPESAVQPIVLYGLLIVRGKRERYVHSIAGNRTRAELRQALRMFLQEVHQLPQDAPIYHWGSYERNALHKMGVLAPELAARVTDLHQCIRKAVLLPTRSRQLKELAAGLGIQKTSQLESGLLASDLWQEWVEERRRTALAELLAYNRSDLRLLAETLRALRAAQ